jgi:phosphoglucosamine mutase
MKKLFGTDGIRGVAGVDLTPDLAYKVGRAAAIIAAGDTERPKLVIGRDTRLSGELLENAVVAGATAAGADVVRVGIIPTPAVAYLTREMKFDGGIVISASHNPIDDNGIKLFDRTGFKFSPDQEKAVELLVVSDPVIDNEMEPGRATNDAEAARRKYVEYMISCLPVRPEGVKIVLDCCYGAAYKVAGDAFRAAGAEVIEIHNEARGDLINVDCGSTNPARAGQETESREGYFGLAFDGDADRVIAVDENGETCDGDFIIAIIADYLRKNGKLINDTIVGTVMANYGFVMAMEDIGVGLVKADVGDRYVLMDLQKHGLNFGGEQSGHIIFMDYTTTGDGILTGLMLASIVASTGKPISELKRVMKKMPQVLINVPVGDKTGLGDAAAVWAEAEQAEHTINGKGRILIRPSGTEPLVRVMVEAETQSKADEIANKLATIVKKELGGKI